MAQLIRTAPLALSPSFLNFLDEATSDPDLEHNWVEMLSQLEYVGCRKMLRSLAWEDVDLKILKHIQEEAQHAYLLKLALGKKGLSSWGQNPLGELGWEYFAGLDESLTQLDTEEMPYALTSWAIEQRALAVYPAYLARTTNADIRRAVRTVLAQEEHHAKFFGDEAWSEKLIADILSIEKRHWEAFEMALTRTLAARNNPAQTFYPSPIWEWKEIAATD